MNVFQIAEKFKLPLAKVKAMQKAGVLNCAPVDERPARLKNILRRKNHLPVLDCITLIQDKPLLHALGVYRAEAESQLAALGDVAGQSFGPMSANLIYGAAILDPDSLAKLADHITAKLAPGLSYHALGCRMLWEVPDHLLKSSAGYLRVAIKNLRHHPRLAEWFEPQKPLDL